MPAVLPQCDLVIGYVVTLTQTLHKSCRRTTLKNRFIAFFLPLSLKLKAMACIVVISKSDHVNITTYILNFRAHRPYKVLVILRVIKIQTANALSPFSSS